MSYFQTLRTKATQPVWQGALAVFFVFLIALFIRYSGNTDQAVSESSVRSVTLSTPAEVVGSQSFTLIGTVRAFTEAELTTERAGRVTSVNTSLGATVSAGQIIATLENAAEQAAVLQAQGAYEAAQAAAAQSSFSLSDAENSLQSSKLSAINTFKSAYGSVNSALLNNIDPLLGNPDSSTPWLRFESQGDGATLLAGREQIKANLGNWNAKTMSITTTSDLESELSYAEQQVITTINLLDNFITVLSNQDGAAYTGTVTAMVAKRAELLSIQNSLSASLVAIDTARDGVERARLSAAGNSISTADAQVKQALGSLRAAQANLAKTILRTPITGTVNQLDVSIGDFVGAFQEVALVANNDALEIIAYVGDVERDQLVAGDEVLIDGTEVGIVTTIAPSVDPETKKTEVRIAVESDQISNGDTVRITKSSTQSSVVTEVRIPLTAVKFESSDGFIYTVEDGVVAQRAVTLGPVQGSYVQIETGLSANESFITDVRGLTVGQPVGIK